jgi:glycosyltransferase involved in cell wall biosynthesis
MDLNDLDLTAVIACKDRRLNLEFCIKSISLCVPRPKLLIVDFGSSTPVVVKEYPWVKVVRVDRNTAIFHKTRALNIGIKEARTTYICMTDADQIFAPNFFLEVYKKVVTHKSFVMCYTYFLYGLPSGVEPKTYTNETYKVLLDLAKKAKKPPHGEGCCNALDRNWLIDVHGHDERYIGWGFEDKNLFIRAQYCGYQEVRINNVTSMVHLPHSRDKAYFNKEYRLRNEYMFQDMAKKFVLVANLEQNWGSR